MGNPSRHRNQLFIIISKYDIPVNRRGNSPHLAEAINFRTMDRVNTPQG